MKARWVFRAVVVLAFCVLRSPVRAEELGFPKGCIELQKLPPEVFVYDTFSTRDSVLFRLELASGKDTNRNSRPFVAWDTETGKWLARRPAPNALAHKWQFSPDGKLLAVPVFGFARIVQLWEVGAKDQQGVPQLRLLTELRTKVIPLKKGQPDPNPPWIPYLEVAWTPDSKTLIVRYNFHRISTAESQILFWSFTDKPSVLPDSNEDDRGARAWKPWAKLEFEDGVEFAVSPDNRTLGVIEHWLRPPNGYFFDLQTAQQRVKFEFDRDRDVRDPNVGGGGIYIPQFSPDSKTLAVHGHRYFTLWNTDPPSPRVNMLGRDFSDILGSSHNFAFTSDSRWMLTCNIARNEEFLRRKGGVLQVRDAQTGDVRHAVSFPEQLGLLHRISDLPDHRVLLRFWSRKGHRQFLWHTDDLLRYAVEHGTPPR